MKRRLFVFFLALALLTTQVFAGQNHGLKAAFDEFTYAMEVEGASLDPVAKKLATEELKKAIEAAIAEGATSEEIYASALAQVKNKALAEEMKQVFLLQDQQNLSADESIKLLQTAINKSYAQGANWSGGSAALILTWVAVVLLIVVVTVTAKPGKCTSDPAYYEANKAACDALIERASSHDPSWYDHYDD